jgi:hypothetical protein
LKIFVRGIGPRRAVVAGAEHPSARRPPPPASEPAPAVAARAAARTLPRDRSNALAVTGHARW